MAGNATFELASANLHRSGNFRDGSESRMFGSGFAVPRGGSSSVVASDDFHTLPQCISLEPIVIRDQISWYDELRRVFGISVGSTAEENSFRAAAAHMKPLPPMTVMKDLKRFRLSVEDTCVKARVRANKMDERLRKLDKYYEDLTSKKQKRSELMSNDRAGALKWNIGTQINSINQRVEDRPKNILLNKRVRTSVAESRAKDGNLHEDNGGDSDLFEKIRKLAAGGEGWDKKVKRKRSTGTVSTRPIDSDGVPKRPLQNKVVKNGSHPHDAHIYRLNNHDDTLSNRKRAMPPGSSSPPMAAAQWVGQRPQKMARARRPFLVSLVPNQDEKRLSSEDCSPPDVGARLNNGHKKLIVKLDNGQSSPQLSESQQSVGGQSRVIDKEFGNSEIDAIAKNKPIINATTPNPFQSRKAGSKKNGSKPGRRLKKLSDRKGFFRHSPLENISSPDCTGASDDDREELLAAANYARTATHLAFSNPFWKKMEPVFASVSSEDKSFLSQQMNSISDPLSENGSFSGRNDVDDKTSNGSIPLYQRVLSALIIENDIDTPEEVDAKNMQFQNQNPFCVSAYDDTFHLNDESMCANDTLLLELESIGLYPDTLPGLEDEENENIQYEIDKLKTRLHQQEVKKKAYLEKISKDVNSNSGMRDLEIHAMDRLVELAYRKLLATRRSSRSGIQKVPKQVALAFGKRTLARCHNFENSGTSCFNEPQFQDIFTAPSENKPDEASATNGRSSNRGKKKLLDDISTTAMRATKGKRSERDTTKSRKTKQKTKPRQKTGQIPTPGNRSTHPTGPTWASSANRTNQLVDDLEPLDEMGVGGDHDLTSFLNFDEQDPEVDFAAGLDIPMDDLTELF